MTNDSEFECALTGLQSDGSPNDTHSDDGDLPVGWTRVTMVRRAYNPAWILIQQVKERMVQGLMSQLTEELQRSEELPIRVQIDAQFAALDQATPKYVRDVEDVLFLSDSGDVFESLNEVRSLLGLDKLDEDVEEEEEAEEAVAEGGE